MQSKATTVREYLASLPADRREIIEAVRKVIRDNLDPAIDEGMSYGMIGYAVPHSVYPPGYHCNPAQPLPYAGLASQKQGISLYLMTLCSASGGEEDNAESRWFRDAWAKTGKKLDMGKACIRFARLEDIPLSVVGEAIRRMPAQRYIEAYERSLEEHGITHKGKKALAKASAKPKTSASPAASKPAPKTAKKAAKKSVAKTTKKKTASRPTTTKKRSRA